MKAKKTSPKSRSLLQRVGNWSATMRLVVGLGAATLAGLCIHSSLLVRLVASWDVFALVMLALIWLGMYQADVARIREVAAQEDFGRVVSFLFVLVAAAASLVAVVALLGSMHGLPSAEFARRLGLLLVAVGGAWLLVHTVFTLRYAHQYYNQDTPGKDNGGIDFPGDEKEPDYLDFAYFSFIMGMAAQTADVSISGRSARRLALLHCLIAFSFNTALVALTINGVAGVL